MVDILAKMIDHSLLHPTMTDEDLKNGCMLARQYNVASVCIKPYAVPLAIEWLSGSEVLVGTVVGFPQGSPKTTIKIAETHQACQDGAKEIDMVVNIGWVLSERWPEVKHEISTILSLCRSHGAILKVIFENDFLPSDYYKIKLCEICSEVGVDFVKTSTGYGMVKGADGKYSYQGATMDDLRLMRQHSHSSVQIKAAGGIRTLDSLLMVKEIGVTRIGASATKAILDEAFERYGGESPRFSVDHDVNGY